MPAAGDVAAGRPSDAAPASYDPAPPGEVVTVPADDGASDHAGGSVEAGARSTLGPVARVGGSEHDRSLEAQCVDGL